MTLISCAESYRTVELCLVFAYAKPSLSHDVTHLRKDWVSVCHIIRN